MTKILSLDGGGVRGVIPATWLKKLQSELGKKESLGRSFDYLAGTSTGSLLAAALALDINPDVIIDLYKTKGEVIFPGRVSRLWNRIPRTFSEGFSAPKYSDEGLEKVLKSVFGNKKLGEVNVPTLIVSYDTLNREPVVFKSWKEEHKNLHIWEVCKSSSSAPTYFPAHLMTVEKQKRVLIDGGVVANNPAACILAEVMRRDKEIKKFDSLEHIFLASMGTGQLTRRIDAKAGREWGALEWAIPIIDVLFDGNTDAVDYIVRNILTPNQYSRLQFELTPGKGMDDLDDASLTNLQALERAAQEHISNEGNKVFNELLLAMKG